MNFVSTESLPDLICVTCKKVLSQFPIYCHSDGPQCGRCPYPPNAIRNEAYETLAQKLKFPCCYHEKGCLENLLPKDVPSHEILCSFREYNCPITLKPECQWKGFAMDLIDHVESKHPTFLLNESSFEVDFINSHNENYLLPYGEHLYIVNRRADSKKHNFFCAVSYIGSDASAKESSYKIILESSNKKEKHEICNKMNITTLVDRDVLNSILKDPISIVARIEVFQEEKSLSEEVEDNDEDNPDINVELLRELECCVCMEYMIPPIYQCLTGHSLCEKCKQELKECPTCKEQFQNTKNFALEKVINQIVYPCKYSKCKFTAKAKHIKQHEATCTFAPYPCPLREYIACTIDLQFEKIYEHVVNNHYEHLLELESVSLPFSFQTNDIIEDCFIIKHDSKLFKLHFLYDNEEKELQFAAQLIGPSKQSSEYSFEIDIVGMNGKNHRALCSRSCGPSTDKELAFQLDNEFILFSDIQFEHLITDQLCFRARIKNN